MELEIQNGKIVWRKKDGSLSKVKVSGKSILRFCGFPELEGPGGGICNSVKIIVGNPLKSKMLMVKASGNSWWGEYAVSKNKYVKIHPADDAKDLETILDSKTPREEVKIFKASGSRGSYYAVSKKGIVEVPESDIDHIRDMMNRKAGFAAIRAFLEIRNAS